MSWRIALLLIISWSKQSTGYATLFSPHTPQMTISQTNKVKREFVRSIVAIARSVKSQVIAEGIETAQEFETLCEIGMDYLQGYYFAKPSPTPSLQIIKSAQRGWQQIKDSREIYNDQVQVGELKQEIASAHLT
ncbi:EAL domain-containing protein [Pseudomonas sp. C27(2019)]|uniref:EAL domain-containing protein n=1 Tax=Pseudomonas sp. C27(2019) TaxID=2604941 RepID=UPI0012440A9A|nr:EAL domain-containing protein [Pseudomonas sp. C27(2019)]QEY58933.1 EAL domain-containing protein [Pseudomonas sp. C27(2019)]